MPDIDSARAEAMQSPRDLLADLLRQGKVVDGHVFEITNEAGHVLERLPFASAVKLR